MGKVAFFLVLVAFSFSFSWEEGIKKFFQRDGYVVSVEKDRAIIDIGKGNVKEGEVFDVYREGKDIVHPVTGKVIGKETQTVGKIKVINVQDGFSVATIESGTGIKTGDRIKLYRSSVCYQGSDEGFFKVSSVVEGLKKGSGCDYVIKEFQDGYGIEFLQNPVAFFSKPTTTVANIGRATIEDLNLLARSKLIKALPSLPLSADIGDILGNKKDFLVVLFSGKLEVYEVLKNDMVLRMRYSLPAGVPVSVTTGKIGKEDRDYIIVNMVSGDTASSVILKAVGDTLLPVRTGIPYIMGVLDKANPKETFVGQRFDFSNKFGQAVKLTLEDNNLKETGVFVAPRGFRIDSAFMYGEYLVFTDANGRLRIYKGGNEVFSSEEGFGGSYTSVQIPVLDSGKMNYIFNPKGAKINVVGFDVALVVKNTSGFVQKFLDILKYSQGEVYMIGERRKDLVFLKQVRGSTFEESVQAIVRTSDGRILVLTGKTGTIPVQNKGDIYELEFRVL